ncbi:hypothetical protein D3C71_1513040 [compost metagenome]
MTEQGVRTLRDEVISSLSSSRERDNRFDLGLAALPFVKKDKAIEALRERLDFLGKTLNHLKQLYESQGGAQLPLHVRALFLHPVSLIENEQAFVSNIIHELLGETEEHD